MGRTPCCNKEGLRKGVWTPEEDKILVDYITKNGHGNWRSLPKLAGLLRCGKSCRLRWANYLRPDIKRGQFSKEELDTIIQLHSVLGNKWSAIASHLPGRTDNDIKNYWNSHLRKWRGDSNIQTHQMSQPFDMKVETPTTNYMPQWESAGLEFETSESSQQPLLLDLSSASEIDCDPFLRLWNSEAGESFRGFKKSSQSPVSQASSSSKFESSSGVTLQNEPTSKIFSSADTIETKNWGVAMNCKVEEEDTPSVSEPTKSYELDDPSDTALKLLLDFPGVNDMGLFPGAGDNLSFLQG